MVHHKQTRSTCAWAFAATMGSRTTDRTSARSTVALQVSVHYETSAACAARNAAPRWAFAPLPLPSDATSGAIAPPRTHSCAPSAAQDRRRRPHASAGDRQVSDSFPRVAWRRASAPHKSRAAPPRHWVTLPNTAAPARASEPDRPADGDAGRRHPAAKWGEARQPVRPTGLASGVVGARSSERLSPANAHSPRTHSSCASSTMRRPLPPPAPPAEPAMIRRAARWCSRSS